MKTKFDNRENKKIPWRENAFVLIGSYSIFVALVGVLLTAVILDAKVNDHWKTPVVLFCISIVSFIWAIEKSGEALDEDDIEKYLTWLLAYNAGVITLFFGTAYFIMGHFDIGCWSSCVIIAVTLLVSSKWIRDIFYLLGKNEKEYVKYKQELLGIVEPTPDPDLIMKIHSFIRRTKTQKMELPHENAFTRLAPSDIHGIGVFAIRDISKGTNIFANDKSQMVWFDKSEIDALNLSENERKLYEDFCVIKDGKYGCPENFNSLTIGWYLNEPKKGVEPNVYSDENYDFYASRDIKAREELTVDYSSYSQI